MIEIGEYIRYEGFITKVIEQVGLYSFKLDNGTVYDPRDIAYEGLKHSKNIIDLIEVGDYVNGEKVVDVWNGNRIETHRSNFSNEDIKTILTKEQMEANCYQVEEE